MDIFTLHKWLYPERSFRITCAVIVLGKDTKIFLPGIFLSLVITPWIFSVVRHPVSGHLTISMSTAWTHTFHLSLFAILMTLFLIYFKWNSSRQEIKGKIMANEKNGESQARSIKILDHPYKAFFSFSSPDEYQKVINKNNQRERRATCKMN